MSVYGTVTVNLALEGFLGNSATKLNPPCDFIFSRPLELVIPDLPGIILAASNGHTIARFNLGTASLLRKFTVVLEY